MGDREIRDLGPEPVHDRRRDGAADGMRTQDAAVDVKETHV
jgi:hypothetical protein